MASKNQVLDAALNNSRPFISDLIAKIRLHRTRDQDDKAAALLILLKPLIALVPGDNAQRFERSLEKLDEMVEPEPAPVRKKGGKQ